MRGTTKTASRSLCDNSSLVFLLRPSFLLCLADPATGFSAQMTPPAPPRAVETFPLSLPLERGNCLVDKAELALEFDD